MHIALAYQQAPAVRKSWHRDTTSHPPMNIAPVVFSVSNHNRGVVDLGPAVLVVKHARRVELPLMRATARGKWRRVRRIDLGVGGYGRHGAHTLGLAAKKPNASHLVADGDDTFSASTSTTTVCWATAA